MAAPLPLKEQIIAAGRMALRCHTHLALWRLTAGVEGRARHREVLADHWEHIRFLEHGQLFTAVIELHSLLDANPATINLPHLTDELEAEHGPQTLIRQALREAEATFGKLRKLRNGVYAHRTKRKAYADMFKQAAITPDQLQELSVLAIAITNELREAIDLEAEAPTTLPAEFYERMLEQLAK
ncbi:hypothetical protein AAG614_03205 [Citromicrobium bathyomarinum]|uniref:AbiU2 domain-containing protein n=1 Tax=Citromicrobium bathyomarinum TaxID=72174 RepID=UPI001E2CC1AB|nr:hypothetical protein [Citromicrobium bathyomarinum]MCD1624182.1 hypothetical protein [Citromicrobium bathyomarinum]